MVIWEDIALVLQEAQDSLLLIEQNLISATEYLEETDDLKKFETVEDMTGIVKQLHSDVETLLAKIEDEKVEYDVGDDTEDIEEEIEMVL